MDDVIADIEAKILAQLNWVRTRPLEAVEVLKERRQYYKGKDYSPPERHGCCIVTKEGAAVVDETIAYLQALTPMEGLGESSEKGLALAGEDHIADIGVTGTASHSSSDGTNSAQRVSRYGHFMLFGECLWYGSELADARTIVLDLVVDDGVPSRGHRKGVLDPRYTTVGVAYGMHKTFGRMAALEFARGWNGDDESIHLRLESGPPKIDAKVLAEAKSKAGTQWALGKCGICHEPIKGGKVIDVAHLGGKLHSDCFRCSGCSTSLVGVAYKVHSSTAFCTSCYFERYGEKCQQCSKVITGAMVKCSLGVLHVECVICSSCNKEIGKNPFSTSAGVIRCQSCASEASISSPSARPAITPAPKRLGARSLASAGSAIATPAASSRSLAAAAKAIPGSKVSTGPKAKAKAKISMGQAHTSLSTLGMDYSSLG